LQICETIFLKNLLELDIDNDRIALPSIIVIIIGAAEMYDVILMLIAGPMFLLSLGGHIYVKLKMRPKDDIDEYYYEFEDQHPDLARYEKWSRITFAGAVIAALLLFVSISI
jgi:hypothetical protein